MAFNITDKFVVQVEIDGEKYKATRDMASYDLVACDLNISATRARACVLTVRTNASSGTLTMADADHGILTGDKLDLYWLGTGSRRFATVGTVSGTSVPFSVGTGDNLPSADTALHVMVPILQAVPTIDATTFTAWGAKFISSTGGGGETIEQATMVFGHGSFTEDAVLRFNLTGGAWHGQACWNNEHMEANPLAAATAMTKIYVSHADVKNTLVARFGAGVA